MDLGRDMDACYLCTEEIRGTYVRHFSFDQQERKVGSHRHCYERHWRDLYERKLAEYNGDRNATIAHMYWDRTNPGEVPTFFEIAQAAGLSHAWVHQIATRERAKWEAT